MVLAVASLPQGFAAVALEIGRCGVEKDQLQPGEQVASMGEQLFFDPILDTSGRERRLVFLLILGQFLAEPSHGSVEVMELERLAALDLVVLLPFVSGSIAPGGEQTMEDGEKDGPFNVELEPT